MLCACSKNDSPENPNLPLNAQNITGVWYFSKVIQPNGEVLNYINPCTTKRDQVEFYLYQSVREKLYADICGNSFYSYQCQGYEIHEGNRLKNCSDKYNGICTITANTLQIDYGMSIYFGYPENNMLNAKGIILTRN